MNKNVAFYALYLVQVSTSISATIKYSAIKRYLTTEESIAINHKQLHPLLNEHDQEAQCIKKFYVMSKDVNQF